MHGGGFCCREEVAWPNTHNTYALWNFIELYKGSDGTEQL